MGLKLVNLNIFHKIVKRNWEMGELVHLRGGFILKNEVDVVIRPRPLFQKGGVVDQGR